MMMPWTGAARLFRDRAGLTPADPRIARASTCRSVLGIAGTVYVAGTGIQEVLADAVNGTFQAVVIGAIVSVVAIVLLYVATPLSDRGIVRQGLGPFRKTIGLALVTMVVPFVAVLLMAQQLDSKMNSSGPTDPGGPSGTEVLFGLAFAVFLLWWFPFVLVSMYHLGRSMFSIAEVHPMLGPVCGFTTAAISTVIQLLSGGTAEHSWALLTACGLGSLAAISAWEYLTLHRAGWRLPR